MQILVTGGAGFIGSHLVDRLLLDGHKVVVVDSFSTGRKSNLYQHTTDSNLRVVQVDILDTTSLEQEIREVQYVFHLAAAVGVFTIVNKPLESLLTNIRGTENVLEIASKYQIPVFLTSSSEVYGKNISNSLTESSDRILGSPTTLRWSYSEAKAIDESLAYAYYVEKNLPTRIVRFFNTVGPRQLGAYGMVVPRFVQAALKNLDIEIYGDGLQTRCFAHIYDAIDAIMAVAFAENTIGKVINIGNNVEISINDLAKVVIDQTASSSKIVHIPYNEAYGSGFEDMERRVPNIELIKSLVGWSPKRNLKLIISDIVVDLQKKS